MTNYEIQPGHSLIVGSKLHREGEVLPGWYANRDGGLAARVSAGCLASTDKLHTVEVAPAEAKVADDPTAALYAEIDRVSKENAAYAASNKELAGRLEAAETNGRNLAAELGLATIELANIRAAAEKHKAEVERLTAEVETLTAPAAPAA